MPAPALLAWKGMRKSVIQHPTGLKINSRFSISKSLHKTEKWKGSQLPLVWQGKHVKYWTLERIVLAALPKSVLHKDTTSDTSC